MSEPHSAGDCSNRSCERCGSSFLGRRLGGPRIIPFLEKRVFDFSNIASGLTSSLQLSVILCPTIFVLGCYRVRLAVRVHAISIPSNEQAIRFIVNGTMPSEEDPTQDFIDPNTFLSVDLTQSTVAPSLVTATATDPDAYLRITLNASQATIATTLTAELSAALVLGDF